MASNPSTASDSGVDTVGDHEEVETLEEVVRPTPAWRRRITNKLDEIRANPTGRIA